MNWADKASAGRSSLSVPLSPWKGLLGMWEAGLLKNSVLVFWGCVTALFGLPRLSNESFQPELIFLPGPSGTYIVILIIRRFEMPSPVESVGWKQQNPEPSMLNFLKTLFLLFCIYIILNAISIWVLSQIPKFLTFSFAHGKTQWIWVLPLCCPAIWVSEYLYLQLVSTAW